MDDKLYMEEAGDKEEMDAKLYMEETGVKEG